MHSTPIVVAPAFQPGSRNGASAVLRIEPTESRGRRAAWTRFVALLQHGGGTSDAGPSAAATPAPPRRDRPLPFC